MRTPLRMHGTKFQRSACLLAREHTSSWRGRMARRWPWATCTCVTITIRFDVSIILVVITTVKAPCIVAISLLHSKSTSVGILIRHRMERATKVLVAAFTFALMAWERRRRRPCRFASCGVSALWPEMAENRHRHASIIRMPRPKEGAKESPRPTDGLSMAIYIYRPPKKRPGPIARLSGQQRDLPPLAQWPPARTQVAGPTHPRPHRRRQQPLDKPKRMENGHDMSPHSLETCPDLCISPSTALLVTRNAWTKGTTFISAIGLHDDCHKGCSTQTGCSTQWILPHVNADA